MVVIQQKLYQSNCQQKITCITEKMAPRGSSQSVALLLHHATTMKLTGRDRQTDGQKSHVLRQADALTEKLKTRLVTMVSQPNCIEVLLLYLLFLILLLLLLLMLLFWPCLLLLIISYLVAVNKC